MLKSRKRKSIFDEIPEETISLGERLILVLNDGFRQVVLVKKKDKALIATQPVTIILNDGDTISFAKDDTVDIWIEQENAGLLALRKKVAETIYLQSETFETDSLPRNEGKYFAPVAAEIEESAFFWGNDL